MNFFEKAQARAHALTVLGLEGHPNADEIKTAYKKQVFDKHPDRGHGTDADIRRIKDAYALLNEDEGYCPADLKRQPPEDLGDTSFRTTADPKFTGDPSSRVAPRRMRTAQTSRITDLGETDALECRRLLDEIDCVADSDPDEESLRANILDIIKETDAPFVPHTNHLPYSIRQSGRSISYMVGDLIAEGVNRVAVPTGVFTDNRKVRPVIVRFNSDQEGIGTHVVPRAVLAESFPGAKSVRLHFGMVGWPKSAAELDRAPI